MFRTLLKLIILVVILVAVGSFVLGYWSVGTVRSPFEPRATGTSGHVDVDKARQTGAEIGEKTAVAAERAKDTLDDAALTTKIKAKMGLDDLVQARHINVTTDNGVVTLKGTVGSQAERQQAVRLARETAGVKSVIDHLQTR